jgi:two-component system invasion response regulator UvrY
MIKISIIDDHAIVRKGLISIIADCSDMEVTFEASGGAEGLRLVRKNDLDVVLLDISMPGLNGLETLQQIKNERPHLPVLMLSVHPEEQYAVRALKLGASGYLTKESAPSELLAAIRKVAAGGRYVNINLAEKLAEYIESDSGRPPHEALSNRELQVMLLIASGKPVKTIAEELSLSAKTVSTHRTRLLGKMRLGNNAEVMRYAMEHNLS